MAWLVSLLAWLRESPGRWTRGKLVYSDLEKVRAPLLRSERYRLSGRPDEIRIRGGRAPVPVELKTGRAPRQGLYPAHRIQLLAYCLLVEESYGIPPLFGILRYSDGTEFRLPWTEEARQQVLRIRREVDLPYQGAASPSEIKCRGCGYRAICDVRAV